MLEQRDLQKTNFWAKRAAGAISVMKRARETGLFPKSEGWRNVVENELVEAEAADVLAEMLGLSTEDRQNLRTAALLHDVFKRKEIEEYSKLGAEGFDKAAVEQARFIRDIGLSEEIVGLTESVASTSLSKFINRDGKFVDNYDQIPQTEKILHYIDDITK